MCVRNTACMTEWMKRLLNNMAREVSPQGRFLWNGPVVKQYCHVAQHYVCFKRPCFRWRRSDGWVCSVSKSVSVKVVIVSHVLISSLSCAGTVIALPWLSCSYDCLPSYDHVHRGLKVRINLERWRLSTDDMYGMPSSHLSARGSPTSVRSIQIRDGAWI